MKHLIKLNIALFALDFSGAGRSEGDFLTLGLKE